jgi:hypothetical protein
MATTTDGAIQRVMTDNTLPAAEQRVDMQDPITTSTNPTAPRIIATTPRVHQRNTRNNTPGKTAPIVPMLIEPRQSP